MNRPKKVLATLAAAAAVAAGVTVASASAPDPSGVIHGCRSNLLHTVTILDTATQSSCPLGSTAVNWNQTGVIGPQGPAGVAGASSMTGSYLVSRTIVLPIDDGSTGGGQIVDDISLYCNSGDLAVGSGYAASTSTDTTSAATMTETLNTRSATSPNEWDFTVHTHGTDPHPGSVTVNVVCLSQS